MRWSAILAGALGLAVLDAVVSSQQSAARVGGLLTSFGGALDRFISPAKPAFDPVNSGSSSSQTTTAQTTQQETTPPALSYGGSAAGIAVTPTSPTNVT